MRQEKMRQAAAGAAQFRAASDQSLLISFGQHITPDSHQRVLKLLHLLQAEPIEGIRNLHPAYCSLLIKFDPLRLDHDEVQSRLVPYLARLGKTPLPAPQQVEIPVCYGGEFGPDLSEVAAMHGMTPAQAVELHSSPIYIVSFLGFAPGFAYLGGLPEALATPGGWRLIGRTPVAMFRRHQDPMNLLQIGDHVRFRPISKEEFAEFSSR